MKNARILALIDSRDVEGRWARRTLEPAFRHLGFAYRFVDTARGLPSDAALSNAAAIVVAQDGLLGNLADVSTRLLRAVDEGCGLVCLDGMLNAAPGPYRTAVGLSEKPVKRDAALELCVGAGNGWITSERPRAEILKLRRPVRIVTGQLEGPVQTEVTDDKERPVVWCIWRGRGRIVQWSIPPTIWSRETLGFGSGLDDILWRGIVWAARKPFVTMRFPPYTRLRFDDCEGLWQSRGDLAFVPTFNAHGRIPSLFVCLDAPKDDGVHYMRDLAAAGAAEFAPHVIRPRVDLYLGDGAHRYTEQELEANFQEIDHHFAHWGLPIAPLIADHNHEFSSLAAPKFLARGMRYRLNVTAPNEHWSDRHVDWHPAPYGLTSYATDEIPGTGIVAVLNHFTPFMDARTQVGQNAFMFDRGGSFGGIVVWDFLNSLVSEDQCDIETAAGRLALHERRAIQSGFVGGSISHSRWLRHLTGRALDLLLSTVDSENAKVERRPVAASEAARRADDHRRSKLVNAAIDGTSIHAILEGNPDVLPQLCVYSEAGDGAISSRWVTLSGERSGSAISCSAEL